MPSPITQILGSALAQVVQPQSAQSAVRDAGTHLTPAQLAQSSQAAAERSTTGVRREDKERATQTPKRVEGAFVSHRVKPKHGDNEDEEDESSNSEAQSEEERQSPEEEAQSPESAQPTPQSSNPLRKGKLDLVA